MSVERGVNRICLLVLLVACAIYSITDLWQEAKRANGVKWACATQASIATEKVVERTCVRFPTGPGVRKAEKAEKKVTSLTRQEFDNCLRDHELEIKKAKEVVSAATWEACRNELGSSMPEGRIIDRLFSLAFWFNLLLITLLICGIPQLGLRIGSWIHRGFKGES
jgi:hypothetical protein